MKGKCHQPDGWLQGCTNEVYPYNCHCRGKSYDKPWDLGCPTLLSVGFAGGHKLQTIFVLRQKVAKPSNI